MRPYPRTILCPVFDPSSSKESLRCAGVLAKTFGARLLLLRVADAVLRTRRSSGTPDASIRRLHDTDPFEDSILAGTRYERFELQGEPTTGIRDFAIKYDADIVVIANGFAVDELAAMGPLVRRIVDSLPCTVMIMKEPACETLESMRSPPVPAPRPQEEKYRRSNWLLDTNHIADSARPLSNRGPL